MCQGYCTVLTSRSTEFFGSDVVLCDVGYALYRKIKSLLHNNSLHVPQKVQCSNVVLPLPRSPLTDDHHPWTTAAGPQKRTECFVSSVWVVCRQCKVVLQHQGLTPNNTVSITCSGNVCVILNTVQTRKSIQKLKSLLPNNETCFKRGIFMQESAQIDAEDRCGMCYWTLGLYVFHVNVMSSKFIFLHLLFFL